MSDPNATQPQWQPTNPKAPPVAKQSWFARHKILTGILALAVLGIIFGSLGGGGDKDKTPASGTTSSAAASDAGASPAASSEAAKPAPAPAAGVGTKVRDGKFEFVVTGVEAGGKEVGQEFLKETAQGTFQLVHISVTNIGDQPQTLFDSNQKVTDDQGRQFAPNSMAAISMENNKIWMSEINPGNTVTGTLVYDMPEGAAPVSIELHDSMFSGGVKVGLR